MGLDSGPFGLETACLRTRFGGDIRESDRARSGNRFRRFSGMKIQGSVPADGIDSRLEPDLFPEKSLIRIPNRYPNRTADGRNVTHVNLIRYTADGGSRAEPKPILQLIY